MGNHTFTPVKKRLSPGGTFKKRSGSFSQESAIFTSPSDLKRLKDKIKAECIPSNRQISRETTEKSKILTIIQSKGQLFDKINDNISINASGFIGNQQTYRNDGVIYFWTQQKNVKLLI